MRKEDKGVYLVNGNRIVSSEEKHLLTGIGFTAVSYTHLTLPTILLV